MLSWQAVHVRMCPSTQRVVKTMNTAGGEACLGGDSRQRKVGVQVYRVVTSSRRQLRGSSEPRIERVTTH